MKKNKGITLIALIITIIILVILTAVTINNVIGTDLIGFATKAAENYIDAEKEEEDKISELISQGGSAVPSTPTTGGTGSSEVAGGLKEYQGKYVDIGLDINDPKKEDGTVDTTDDWEIFYATTDRIFLIAADYVPVTKLTEWGVIGSLSSNGFASSGTYIVNWSTPTTFLDSEKGLADLSLVKHEGYSLTSHQSATDYNSIAVSHLLNTTAWAGIKTAAEESANIDFVIGGPTLEMWCAAWNEAVGEDDETFKQIQPDGTTSSNGYYVGCTATSKTQQTYLYMNGTTTALGDKLTTLGNDYPLFFPHTAVTNNCYGYWLASPSTFSSYSLMGVCYGGDVSYNSYGLANYGVRPVVCLQSGVSLVKNGETENYTLSK